MPMERALDVLLRGAMPQSRLEQLRDLLRLRSRGRLTDAEDMNFGYRYLRQAPDLVLHLWRYEDASWGVRLTYEGEPPSDTEVVECRSDILSAAAQVGLDVDRVWTRSS